MKLAKPLLITGAVVIGLPTLLVGVALIPAVQRAVVLKAANGNPDMKLDLGSISAGPGGVSIRDLDVTVPGIHVKASSLELDASLLSAAMSDTVSIDSLTIEGLEVDASKLNDAPAKPASEETPATKTPFRGVLTGIKLPKDVRLGSLAIDGNVKPPSEPGGITRELSLKVRGQDFAPGQEGKIQIDLADADKLRDLSRYRPNATVVLMATTQPGGTLSAASVLAQAKVIGPKLEAPLNVTLSAALKNEGAKETITLNVRPSTDGKDWLKLDGATDTKSGAFTGQISADLSRADLPPVQGLEGATLPDFVLKALFDLTANPDSGAASVRGTTQLKTGELSALSPELKPLGGAQVDVTVDASTADGVHTVTSLNARAAVKDGAQSILEALVSRPLRVTGDGRIELAPTADTAIPAATPSPDAPIASLRLADIDPALIASFVPGLKLTGRPISGSLGIAAPKGAVVVSSQSPLRAQDLAVDWQGKPVLRGVTFDLAPQARLLDSGELTAGVRFTARSGDGELLSLEVDAQRAAGNDAKMQVKVSGNADLPTLARQPAAAGSLALAKGAVTFRADTELSDKPAARAQVKLQGLTPVTAAEARVGSLDADLGIVFADGQLKVDGPLTLSAPSGAQKIDLTAEARPPVAPATTTNFAVTAKSSLVDADAFQAFADAHAPKSSTETKTPEADKPAGPAKPDTTPVWVGLAGTADLDIAVLRSRGMELKNAKVAVVVDDTAVRLKTLSFEHQGKVASAEGALQFDAAAAASPYTATGSFNTKGFDVGAFLAKLDPSTEPALKTIADVDASFQASGPTLANLADKPAGTVKLRGTQGTMRALGNSGKLLERIGSLYDKAEKGANLASQAAGLAGALGLIKAEDAEKANALAAKTQERIAEGKRYRELVRFLTSMPFEEFALEAGLDGTKEVNIQKLDFLSEQVRMQLSGKAGLGENVTWRTLPVELALAFQARGAIGELMPKDSFDASEGSDWLKLAKPVAVKGNLEAALQQQLTETLLPALLK